MRDPGDALTALTGRATLPGVSPLYVAGLAVVAVAATIMVAASSSERSEYFDLFMLIHSAG